MRAVDPRSHDLLAHAIRPVDGAADDYDALLDLVGSRKVVLIGEATHGTHEFYRERARITCHEALLHTTPVPAYWLSTRDPAVRVAFEDARIERAIGVIYRPETERQSHYFESLLASQFDAVIHWDHTHALEPLERSARWDRGEPPETYPSGI